MTRKIPGKGRQKEMSDNGSVGSVDTKEMMAILDAPVAPTKKTRSIKTTKKAKEEWKPIAVEVPVVVEPEVTVTEPEPEEPNYKEMYETLKVKYDELIAKTTKAKNSNSPDLAEGIHMRMVNGEKTKCKYIFPYQADGGKSIVKEMKDGQECIGVSTTQKNNSKDNCKVADFNLIWINNKMCRDTNTNTVYPHKDGKFAIVDADTMTSFNVRMMIIAE